MRTRSNHVVAAAVGAALFVGLVATGLQAQKRTPAEMATRLSGVWQLNHALSPSFSATPARRSGGGGAGAPAYAIAAGLQRGSRGSGGAASADMSPAERAGRAAIASLQQIAETVRIAATADSVTFTDPRGERTFPLNGKNIKMDLNGGTLMAKSKWDDATLRQEFLYGDTKVTHFWELNDDGTQLSLKIRTEDYSRQGPFKELPKVIYNKGQ